MLDRDLAELYEVSTKVLNQAVKRNIERFLDIFKFQLNKKEKDELVTNCDRFKSLKHSLNLENSLQLIKICSERLKIWKASTINCLRLSLKL